MPLATKKTTPNAAGPRKLTAEQYRVLAAHAETDEAETRKKQRRQKWKRLGGMAEPRWATEGQRQVADKQQAAADRARRKAAAGQRPTSEYMAEQQRQAMIRQRNRRRRLPWYGPATSILAGLAGWGVVSLFRTTTASPLIPAVVVAVIPLLAALTVAVRSERKHHQRCDTAAHRGVDEDELPHPSHRRWAPEVAFAGLGCSGLVFWVALTGVSWLTVLAVLVGTVAGGRRWWRAHPLGPRVPALQPPQPTPPEPVPAPSLPLREMDEYCIAWNDNNAGPNGKAPLSRLSNRVDTDYTVTFDLELKRGQQTVRDLHANRAPLAGGIGEDAENVLFKRHPSRKGAHMAQLTIITRDPVAEPRFYTGPSVDNGVLQGVARFADGSGDVDVTMWDDNGTVPTMVVGSLGGGKSGCANRLSCDALSTGVMNQLYADPKGNSSTALATRARVAIIGKANVLKLPWLLGALLEARGQLATDLDADLLLPSRDVPGWMLLQDEYSLVANDPATAKIWTETVNMVRALGMWPVAMNQSMGVAQWGNDHARSAFASQVIAFRLNSKSGSDLVPGMVYDPNELPYTVNERGKFRPVPGMAVHAFVETPTRWDFLPSDSDATLMVGDESAPPYTTSTAFDAFFNQPEPHPADVAALETILGPAVNGRWQVGGKGATHEFPASLDELRGHRQGQRSQPKGKWGQRGSASGDRSGAATGESSSERRVYGLIRAGTTKRKDIVAACRDRMSEATIDRALDALVSDGHIYRPDGRRGEYATADTDPDRD